MKRITITKARGGFIVEENEENEPAVATRLADILAIAAATLSGAEYSPSVIGDVIILTPTGQPSGSSAVRS